MEALTTYQEKNEKSFPSFVYHPRLVFIFFVFVQKPVKKHEDNSSRKLKNSKNIATPPKTLKGQQGWPVSASQPKYFQRLQTQCYKEKEPLRRSRYLVLTR